MSGAIKSLISGFEKSFLSMKSTMRLVLFSRYSAVGLRRGVLTTSCEGAGFNIAKDVIVAMGAFS